MSALDPSRFPALTPEALASAERVALEAPLPSATTADRLRDLLGAVA